MIEHRSDGQNIYGLLNDTFDPPQYVDRKRRRMAELLVHQHVPVSCILGLGVLNKEMEISVARMIDEAKLQIPVKQKPDWYY